jgi:hypothetical protein
MKTLFDSIQALAREAEAEEATLPADAIPRLSRGDHERIAQSLLRARTARLPTRRSRVLFYFASLSVGIAAMLAFWVRPSSGDRVFPAYTVAASGGAKEARGAGSPAPVPSATAAPQTVRGDTELTVELRPDAAVSGPVAARAYLSRGGSVSELDVPYQAAPSGALQMVIRSPVLHGQGAGQAVLNVIVGRPEAVAAVDPHVVGKDLSGPGWRAVSVPLVFETSGN